MQLKMKFGPLSCFFIFINIVEKCHSTPDKSKNSLPYFRRQVEEDFNNRNIKKLPPDDLQSNLVSFLVNNVEEIFRDSDEVTDFIVSPLSSPTNMYSELPKGTSKMYINSTEEDPNLADVELDYANLSLAAPFNLPAFESVSPVFEIKQANKKTHTLLLSANSLRKSEQKLVYNHTFTKISALVTQQTDISGLTEPGHERSCIFCDNVNYEECSDPENKLIPSVVCERDDDQCYSLHTPFGIIDRGCFNLNRNLTTYVCSCNLCNYIPFSDMPQIFTNKREWAHNVVELSRARNLRNSVSKDMACLKCEVNATDQSKGSVIYNSNCLNGNIGSVPTEICDPKEVCAVKAIKSDSYIWRGCVKSPLYNYYWNVCNSDLCNYDTLISIYDYV